VDRAPRTNLRAWLDELLPSAALGAALWVCCLPAILLVGVVFGDVALGLALAGATLLVFVAVAVAMLRPPRPLRWSE
jgi:hypothetical protein